MTDYGFIIAVDPLPWMRPAQSGRKRFDPPEQVAYKKYVAYMCKAVMIQHKHAKIAGGIPIILEGRFVFPRPASIPAAVYYKASKPDLSNLIKNVEDALNGVAWVDDGQVVGYGDSEKVYTDGDVGAHAFISIRAIPRDRQQPRSIRRDACGHGHQDQKQSR